LDDKPAPTPTRYRPNAAPNAVPRPGQNPVPIIAPVPAPVIIPPLTTIAHFQKLPQPSMVDNCFNPTFSLGFYFQRHAKFPLP